MLSEIWQRFKCEAFRVLITSSLCSHCFYFGSFAQNKQAKCLWDLCYTNDQQWDSQPLNQELKLSAFTHRSEVCKFFGDWSFSFFFSKKKMLLGHSRSVVFVLPCQHKRQQRSVEWVYICNNRTKGKYSHVEFRLAVKQRAGYHQSHKGFDKSIDIWINHSSVSLSVHKYTSHSFLCLDSVCSVQPNWPIFLSQVIWSNDF